MLFVEFDYKGAWKDLSSVFLFFVSFFVSPLFSLLLHSLISIMQKSRRKCHF